MAKRKYIDQIEKLFEKSPVVSFGSISRIISKNGKSKYAKLLISHLLNQHKIFRLTKGFYTKHTDISLAVFCFKPAYLGLQSALSHHNLWEQETIPVIITPKNVRQGIRKVMGGNILIKRIRKDFLFGFKHYKEEIFLIPYSDIEKTIIDMIFFRQDIPKDSLKKARKMINKKTLSVYLKYYSPKFRKKVMETVY